MLTSAIDNLRRLEPRRFTGSIAAVRGLTILVDDLPLPVGALVCVRGAHANDGDDDEALRGEVIGFDGGRSVIMLFGGGAGLAPGMRVSGEQSAQTVQVGRCLLGRVIDGLGRPVDDGDPLRETVARALEPPPTDALRRRRIEEPLPTGVRCIDGLLTIGRGQRIGIFSGAGVGKSTLLASMARHTAAEVNVIALIGERGREVRDFLEQALGPEGLARSVVVVATGDQSPLLRVRAALVAATVAEHFRELGMDVLFMMDSVTRFAQAQRQIGLAVGEQPATRGYPPSVFARLPILLERAGAVEGGGSITGIYAVLVEGDDLDEPISDAARGVLDGHIVLARRLASRGHYPAVDVLASISRVADEVCDQSHIAARRLLVRLLGAWSEAEELISIGAYAAGSNGEVDAAIALKPKLDEFLRQGSSERAEYPRTCRALVELAAGAAKGRGESRK